MLKRVNFNDGYTSEVAPALSVPAGYSIYTGSAIPDNADHNNGDVYLRSNGDIYLKTAGAWGLDSTFISDRLANLNEEYDVISDLPINTIITIPNSGIYYDEKVSVCLNGLQQAVGEDYDLDTSTSIEMLVPLYIGDSVTFRN